MFESASVMDAVEQEPRDMKAESEQPAQGHGRIEKRVCRVLPAAFMEEDLLHGWKGLSSVIEITAYRHIQATGRFSLDKRYYISSLAQMPPGSTRSYACIGALKTNSIGHWTFSLVKIKAANNPRMQQPTLA
ncbi:MAG: hypothetical protein IPH16_21215 [Haliscomenobacter sp.]|nr:hypothetical protein [Haliscomenobacter sp.]